MLRNDRIFRQPQGHLLLIGVSGAGKTTLSRSASPVIILILILILILLLFILIIILLILLLLPARFVAWMNGLTVFQIKVHNKYSAEDFNEDLRQVAGISLTFESL